MLPSEEALGDDFKGRSEDDFQSLGKTKQNKTTVPVSSKPQPLLPGAVFLCSLGGAPGSPSIMISLRFGGDTERVRPEKVKNAASSIAVPVAAGSGVCSCTEA